MLFEVSYHENRINFEVYHALTDGTGAMYFLEELVQNYLILAHPEAKLPRIEPVEEITRGSGGGQLFPVFIPRILREIKRRSLRR